jgi:pimeloyl-ACP methyl ester carboxylesterase
MTPEAFSGEVAIPGNRVTLQGSLVIPPQATGIVAFAHGSGSSRFSPRNRFVAEILHGAGKGTLLFDLLTEAEAENRDLVFDIPLLAERLLQATAWLADERLTRHLPIGCFGASTGAAAALVAAADAPAQIRTVVSRGGRPDLAGERLAEVVAPTLLIVGERDEYVLELNRAAYRQLGGIKELVIVPDATHLFEEPGTLEEAARHAARWFRLHLGAPVRAGRA